MVPRPSTTTPRRRYLVSPPSETRPSLLVELCPSIDETVLNEVRAAMLGLGCSNGLVLDAEQCLILHDTFTSMDPSSIEVDPSRLETARLLDATSAPIEQRLERWLNALVTNWRVSIPHEAWSAPLLTDVVPAAAGSRVRRATTGEADEAQALDPAINRLRAEVSQRENDLERLQGNNEELARLLAQQQTLAADAQRFLAEFDQRRASILEELARFAGGPRPTT